MKTFDENESEHLYQVVYEKLAELLVSLQYVQLSTTHTEDRVAITILEEDILALLEEAEEHFLSASLPPNSYPHHHHRETHSFVSRGETICEEASRLLRELSVRLDEPPSRFAPLSLSEAEK